MHTVDGDHVKAILLIAAKLSLPKASPGFTFYFYFQVEACGSVERIGLAAEEGTSPTLCLRFAPRRDVRRPERLRTESLQPMEAGLTPLLVPAVIVLTRPVRKL